MADAKMAVTQYVKAENVHNRVRQKAAMVLNCLTRILHSNAEQLVPCRDSLIGTLADDWGKSEDGIVW